MQEAARKLNKNRNSNKQQYKFEHCKVKATAPNITHGSGEDAPAPHRLMAAALAKASSTSMFITFVAETPSTTQCMCPFGRISWAAVTICLKRRENPSSSSAASAVRKACASCFRSSSRSLLSTKRQSLHGYFWYGQNSRHHVSPTTIRRQKKTL